MRKFIYLILNCSGYGLLFQGVAFFMKTAPATARAAAEHIIVGLLALGLLACIKFLDS